LVTRPLLEELFPRRAAKMAAKKRARSSAAA
jgi:hypothetical protein